MRAIRTFRSRSSDDSVDEDVRDECGFRWRDTGGCLDDRTGDQRVEKSGSLGYRDGELALRGVEVLLEGGKRFVVHSSAKRT